MTNQKEKRKVPELRFPEFSGEWEEKLWGDLGEYKRSYSYSRAFEGSGKLKHIHYGDIHTKLGPNINNKDELNSININGDHELVQFGDLVIADASEDYKDLGKVTRLNINDSNIISGLHTHLFRVSSEIDSRFLLYYSKTLKYQKLIRRYGTGVSVLGLSKLNLNKFDVNLPDITEQQKIGKFFSKLDRQIELEEKKLALLEEQKKGYMQKIFSQELRFKDENGEEYPEWRKYKLMDVGTYSSSGVDKKINEGDRRVKLLNYMDVYNHKEINNINLNYLMEVTANDKQINNNNVLEGDIFFTPSSETRNDIGKSITIFEDLENCVYSYHIIRVRPNKNKLNKKFSNYYFENNEIKKQLYRLAQGAQRYTLSKNNFEEMSIELPCLLEQMKIGEAISVLDKKLVRQTNKIKKLKVRKQELLNKILI